MCFAENDPLSKKLGKEAYRDLISSNLWQAKQSLQQIESNCEVGVKASEFYRCLLMCCPEPTRVKFMGRLAEMENASLGGYYSTIGQFTITKSTGFGISTAEARKLIITKGSNQDALLKINPNAEEQTEIDPDRTS